MTFQHFRAHRTAHLSVSLTLSAIGLALGRLIMDPSYRLMRPAFQDTTLLWVELLFAFLIDFPLTMAATAVICALTRCRNQGDALTAGLVFLGIFFSLIVVCIAIGDRVPGIGALALTDVFPPALATARRAFSAGALAALMALYLVFDVTLCALGALAGHWFVRIATRREARVRAVTPRRRAAAAPVGWSGRSTPDRDPGLRGSRSRRPRDAPRLLPGAGRRQLSRSCWLSRASMPGGSSGQPNTVSSGLPRAVRPAGPGPKGPCRAGPGQPSMASAGGAHREAGTTGRERKRERRQPPGPASGSLLGEEPHHG